MGIFFLLFTFIFLLFNYSRVIHLSHVIDTDIPHWQGDPPVEFETVAQLENCFVVRASCPPMRTG
jgi:hypothetical protein